MEYEYYGQPLTHQKITPGNTATALSVNCYKYQEWDLPFDSGGTHELVAGDWLVGATGAAKCQIISIGTITGAWAVTGNAAGTLRVKNYVGTAFVDNEVLNHDGADNATVNGLANLADPSYDNYGRMAKCALVVVTANTALINLDGGIPDQSSLVGLPMYASSTVQSSIILRDINEIKKFKVIDYTASTAGYTWVTYFF